MDNLPILFERYARGILDEYTTIQAKWDSTNQGGRRLTIFKVDESGFDIMVDAETYGLIPYAGDWHGPAWESSVGTKDLCEQFMGFVRSLLCADSTLEVRYAGTWAFQWILTYPTEGGFESYETGIFFYNYFGKRRSRILQNQHLPPRYSIQKRS